MKKIKKLLISTLACLMATSTLAGLAACDDEADVSGSNDISSSDSIDDSSSSDSDVSQGGSDSTVQEVDKSIYQVKNGGFQTGDFTNWTTEGEAFSELGFYLEEDAVETTNYFFGKYQEDKEGCLTSSSFKVGGSGFITFMLGGAMNEGLTYVSIVDAATEKELFRFGNERFQQRLTQEMPDSLVAYKANLSTALGKEVKIKLVDCSTANYGYICFDDFVTYYESEPDENFITAKDIKPVYLSATSASSFIPNSTFAQGLSNWQTAGR